MKFTLPFSKEDFIEGNIQFFHENGFARQILRRKLVMQFVLIIFVCLVIQSGLLLFGIIENRTPSLFIGLYITFSVLVLINFKYGKRKMLMNHMMQFINKNMRGATFTEQKVNLTKKQFKCTFPGVEISIPWEDIKKLLASDDFLFLITENNEYHMIIKKGIPDVNEVTTFITEKIKQHA